MSPGPDIPLPRTCPGHEGKELGISAESLGDVLAMNSHRVCHDGEIPRADKRQQPEPGSQLK